MQFRYKTDGNWYKGNTHIHSTASDGGMNADDIAKLYSGAAYDFLFLTDHWVASDVSAIKNNGNLLWLDGIELNGKDHRGSNYHVVCLGKITGIPKDLPFEDALTAARSQGALLILAHPYWMGNSFEDALFWEFDGVEIYNHVCHWLNGKSCGGSYWNAMLNNAPATLAFSADDAHLRMEHPLWNGGWIKVNAPELSRKAIMSAIRHGNYYSSCGPDFESITLKDDKIIIKTSPVKFIRAVGPGYCGSRMQAEEGAVLTETTLAMPDWQYVYLEIEDEAGRRAWSNTLMV